MGNRILFVENERGILDGLQRKLQPERGEWETHFAPNALEALMEMQEHSFDVIVTGIGTTGMDGFDLLAVMRDGETTKDVPVVIMTGLSKPDIRHRALEEGAIDVLTKPVNAKELVARISSALRLKMRQDELKLLNQSLKNEARSRTIELERSRQDIIWRLGMAAEYRDEETGYHVMRVACYSQVLAEEFAMSRDFTQRLSLTTPLHDIGKIGIPDRILLKPGRLTTDERRIMERHCVIGVGILEHYPKAREALRRWHSMDPSPDYDAGESSILRMASSIAITHHERWDGSGYPEGLKGETIPLEGRFVALADTYDALSFARPYKPAYSEKKTEAIIREEAGRRFAPDVVAAFEKAIEAFRSIKTGFVRSRDHSQLDMLRDELKQAHAGE